MQWFIDIITDLIRRLLGYFIRGDPVVFDYDVADFVQNNVWHDLDLSAIVPEGAKCVNLSVVIRSGFVNARVDFRENGMVNPKAVSTLFTPGAAVKHAVTIPCNIDANRVIEYRVSLAGVNVLNLTIIGWWLR